MLFLSEEFSPNLYDRADLLGFYFLHCSCGAPDMVEFTAVNLPSLNFCFPTFFIEFPSLFCGSCGDRKSQKSFHQSKGLTGREVIKAAPNQSFVNVRWPWARHRRN